MQIKIKIIGVLMVLILLSACKPVNFLTRLKRTPREYTLNYCADDIPAPKSEFNKETWIVFSDRHKNATYLNPGGKVKMKEFDFMDAFFVIKQKGEYYQLVKYNADIVENLRTRRFKDRKGAEYCGWIHQSKLLLTKQSATDISTGFKNKQLSIITDSICLVEPGAFFIPDSIITFKDENLSVANGAMPFYNILYTLKISADQKKVLVARKTTVSPDSAKTDVFGWIPASLVRTVGQRLYVDLKTLPESSLTFYDKTQERELPVTSDVISENYFLNFKIPPLKYNPVSTYCRENNDSVSLKTGICAPVIDNSNNYVLNVNGNRITYKDFKEIEKNLLKVNIVFVLEGREKVIQSYTGVNNVIQNLQPFFDNKEDRYSYKFGVVLASQGKTPDSPADIKTCGIINNYTRFMDYLTELTNPKNNYAPLPVSQAWKGLEKAVDLVSPYKDETNILVIIGEAGNSEWIDPALLNRMAEYNCKIMGFQMHSNRENMGNNFVLQIENMIESCAARESVRKRDKIIYTNQIKPRNLFRESSKNVYALDFPERSMSQGWILFPEKDVDLPLDILANCVDTLINQVRWDNDNMMTSLYHAFNTVGNDRYQYSPLFADYLQLNDKSSIHKELPGKFSKQPLMGYLPSQKNVLSDSINNNVKYHLLLSAKELDETMLFLENLSAIEVDYKYKGKKTKNRKKCNCPDDDLWEEEIVVVLTDSTAAPKYRSTNKLRRRLTQAYMAELQTCRLCKRKKKDLKSLTLSEAQVLITGSPTYTPLLGQYQIKDIKDDKQITDAQLDALIEYFKLKKEDLIRKLSTMQKFESNGETYYWVDQQMLP